MADLLNTANCRARFAAPLINVLVVDRAYPANGRRYARRPKTHVVAAKSLYAHEDTPRSFRRRSRHRAHIQ